MVNLSELFLQLQEVNKRQMNVEESGNWKRRKTSRDDDTEDDQENEQEEGEGTQGDVNGDKAPNEEISKNLGPKTLAAPCEPALDRPLPDPDRSQIFN
ncbi:hypothetical protein RR48_05927 [Papilio machaon]|uniref:Uncharacterized protein n=1 Tax=Papilio machaon TaxID=76193 RepID=A0A0N0PE71_PAPMA|nr:hypothetical protein RR48_05927 [Papilio machaon]